MKTKISIIVMMLFTTLLNNSCKKEIRSVVYRQFSSEDYGVVPQGAEPEFVENQLKWIARTLPLLAQNITNFKQEMHDEIRSHFSYERYTMYLHNKFLALPIDFNNEVYSASFVIKPNNDYDSSFFFGFEFEDCFHETQIRFNNRKNQDNFNTKPLVAIAHFENVSDTFTGYYYNNSTNTIDSLDITSENEGDFYIWVVDAVNTCLEDAVGKSKIFQFDPESHCGDGNCQPFLGETPSNCTDCANSQKSGAYTLVLKEIQHLIDKQMSPNHANFVDLYDQGYHETFMGNRYDLFYSYVIISTGDFIKDDSVGDPYMKEKWYLESVSKRAFGRDWYQDQDGYSTRKFTDILLARLKPSKDEVVREDFSTNGTSKRSSASSPLTIEINKTLSYNFVPESDMIFTYLTEWDRRSAVRENPMVFNSTEVGGTGTYNINNIQFKYRQAYPNSGIPGKNKYHKGVPYYWGATYNSILNPDPNFWQDGSTLYGAGSKYFDIINNNDYTTHMDYRINKDGFDGPLDMQNSEMRIRYVLYKNP